MNHRASVGLLLAGIVVVIACDNGNDVGFEAPGSGGSAGSAAGGNDRGGNPATGGDGSAGGGTGGRDSGGTGGTGGGTGGSGGATGGHSTGGSSGGTGGTGGSSGGTGGTGGSSGGTGGSGGEDRCSIPPNPGSSSCGSTLLDVYYFDSDLGRCMPFAWRTGCEPNANQFSSEAECRAACGGPGPTHCDVGPYPGNCEAMATRYWYNASTGQCETFTYTMCGSNGNNFESQSDCLEACAPGTGGAAGAGGSGGIPACCGVDAPCPSGYSCQGTRDNLADAVGTCLPTPTDAGCYNDLDCPADGICTGATTCPCDVLCAVPPSPGTCDPAGEPCCVTTEDCGERLCVGASAFAKGRCMDAPADGSCYTDADCAGGTCVGGSVCPCGANCPTELGTCAAGTGGSGGEGGAGCAPLPSCNWCHGEDVKDSTGCVTGWICANGIDPCSGVSCSNDADCEDDEDCGEDNLCWPDGPTRLAVGVFQDVPNPCTTDPCLPGMVAAITELEVEYVITVDGDWITDSDYDWAAEWPDFNGRQGQTVIAEGLVTYHTDMRGDVYRELELSLLWTRTM